MKKEIKILGLDADDTLWVNETYYRDTEREFAKLLPGFGDEKGIMEQLFAMEIKNLLFSFFSLEKKINNAPTTLLIALAKTKL